MNENDGMEFSRKMWATEKIVTRKSRLNNDLGLHVL